MGGYAGITTSSVDSINWRAGVAEPLLAALQAPAPAREPAEGKVYPNGRDPNTMAGIDDPSRPNQRPSARKPKEIRTDVAKLYEMVAELKNR